MSVTLTIIRYKKRFIPIAFLAMALHRFPLWFNKNISFYKLMGSGKNGTFDKTPDLQQWAILSVYKESLRIDKNNLTLNFLYGSFISKWLALFGCEVFTILLEAVESHGEWDKAQPFGKLRSTGELKEPIAVLTRATIRLNKLKYFWQNVAPVAAVMPTAKGFITSFGIGEIPWIKQATFSVWESKEDMKAFAYGMKIHAEVIKKTRQQKWYSEEMFTRFRIIASAGSIKGENPLKGLL